MERRTTPCEGRIIGICPTIHIEDAHSGERWLRYIEGKKNTEERDVTFGQLIKDLEDLSEGGKGPYIFRGQSRSSYGLQPYALRKEECERI